MKHEHMPRPYLRIMSKGAVLLAVLMEEMKLARKAASSDNHSRWSLEPLSSSIPEDKEIRSLIEAAGITSD